MIELWVTVLTCGQINVYRDCEFKNLSENAKKECKECVLLSKREYADLKK